MKILEEPEVSLLEGTDIALCFLMSKGRYTCAKPISLNPPLPQKSIWRKRKNEIMAKSLTYLLAYSVFDGSEAPGQTQ